jgi:predicted DNA binding protein
MGRRTQVSADHARKVAVTIKGPLTEKQRRVLTTAYRLGSCDLLRRISSEPLPEELNLHKLALAAHRRKADSASWLRSYEIVASYRDAYEKTR